MNKNINFSYFLRVGVKYTAFVCVLLAAIVFISETFEVSSVFTPNLKAATIIKDRKEIAEIASEILSDKLCPCQCGNYLPNNSKSPACFGCSVGKAEITHVLESLEAGRTPLSVSMDLMTPVIIEVFADYTNNDVSQIWNLVKRVSGELHQTRVVLRTPGFTLEGRRAVKLAECARLNGQFNTMQTALIDHQGPWDRETLVNLAGKNRYNVKQIEACLDILDVNAQTAKDLQHAKERNIRTYPTVTINRQKIPNTAYAIRRSIEKIILKDSI
ncbi:MAG: DsbA family protein [Candidatus Anammoxibacter sp.]